MEAADDPRRRLPSERSSGARVEALVEEFSQAELLAKLRSQLTDLEAEIRGDPRRRQPGMWGDIDELKATIAALEKKQEDVDARIRTMETEVRINEIVRKTQYAVIGVCIAIAGAFGFAFFEILKRLAEVAS